MKKKNNGKRKKVLLWLLLILGLNIILINLAITQNNLGTIPRTNISYSIFDNSILGRTTIFLSEAITSEILLRILLTTISVVGCYSLFNIASFLAGKDAGIIAMLLYVLSPAHLFFFSTLNPLALLIIFLLLGFSFFLNSSNSLKVIGTLILVFSSLLSFVALLFFLVLTCINILSHKSYRKTKIFLLILLIISVSTSNYLLNTAYELVPSLNQGITDIVFEFGNIFGISLITAVYGIIGLFVAKINSKRVFIIFFLLSILVLFHSLYYLPILNILFCILAGKAAYDSFSKKWEIKNAMVATICTLFGIFALSTSLFFNVLPEININEELVRESEFIVEKYPLQNIATHPYYMPLLEYTNAREHNFNETTQNPLMETKGILAHRRNLKELILLLNNTENSNEKLSSFYNLFYSREMDKTLESARELNVKYILITDEMKKGLVWNHEEEGLLFLLRNHEVFEERQIGQGIEIVVIKEQN
ncbi:MAG: hypothetical protein PWQ87_321 [Candidatus Woesearchaeota archaeon]|nr:hypothetical protein [Candidatus Woesearchaeota archaeon]